MIRARTIAAAALFVVLLLSAQPAREAPPSPPPATERRDPAPQTTPESGRAPNEAGQIMILMYHRFSPVPGEWNRTPEEFRRDLETLYDQGYRLLSLRALLEGRVTTPRGYTPVVLTFDDGWRSQFNYLTANGQTVLDPDSAVGILYEFHRRHPDMGLSGTFYLNADLFGQPALAARKLAWLVDQGFEMGNHTFTHLNLRQSSPEAGRRDLSRMAEHLSTVLPGYRMDTMALPFGAMPHDETVAREGGKGAAAYRHRAVLLVGANPAPSPYATAFDPFHLPRVRASESELARWLAHFARHPEKRFVSDGDPRLVTVPADAVEQLDQRRIRTQGRSLVVTAVAEPGSGDGPVRAEPAAPAQRQR